VLAVNGAAFVMVHLAQFRLAIATAAVVSALVLNGLAANWILGAGSRRMTPLFTEYRRWWIGLAMFIVVLTAALGGALTYLGMSDPRRLPDPVSVLSAAGLLLIPLALAAIAKRKGPASVPGPSKNS
jgi:hypothetical protein